jgi:hypothetical protein
VIKLPGISKHIAITDANSDATTIGFLLDNEQRARVRDCLAKERLSLTPDGFERFIRDIEASIAHFLAAAPGEPSGTRTMPCGSSGN